jgi:hypothetical protein
MFVMLDNKKICAEIAHTRRFSYTLDGSQLSTILKYIVLAEIPGVARVDHRTKCVSLGSAYMFPWDRLGSRGIG